VRSRSGDDIVSCCGAVMSVCADWDELLHIVCDKDVDKFVLCCDCCC
jgi:hypothetical protein